MPGWLNLGQNLRVNAKKFPRTIALKDRARAFTYPETNSRVNRLAHSLPSLGLQKGDRISVLMEDIIEIVEVFLAAAKTGFVIVPINFRLLPSEVEYRKGLRIDRRPGEGRTCLTFLPGVLTITLPVSQPRGWPRGRIRAC